jgi:hypothetical protein
MVGSQLDPILLITPHGPCNEGNGIVYEHKCKGARILPIINGIELLFTIENFGFVGTKYKRVHESGEQMTLYRRFWGGEEGGILCCPKVFPLNSQGVPIKFSMCSSRCSQLEHTLSHMFCLKLTFNTYKL